MPIKKDIFNIFYYSQLMIIGLIIFLTQYFQGEKMILWLESTLSIKGTNVFFPTLFFPPFMNKNGWDRNVFRQFFQVT
jgi:hypothetical protein